MLRLLLVIVGLILLLTIGLVPLLVFGGWVLVVVLSVGLVCMMFGAGGSATR
jgi:hypothetical protein